MTATPTKDREQPNVNAEQPGQLAKNQASLAPPSPPVAANRTPRPLLVSVSYAVTVSIIGLGLFASIAASPLYVEDVGRWDLSSLAKTLTFARHSHRVLTSWVQSRTVSDLLTRRPALLTLHSPCCGHQQL